jgi:chemotaxis protein CheX
MTHTASLAEIRGFMIGHLNEVFSTMLSMTPETSEHTEPPDAPNRVTGVVGMAGEEIDGVLYLHLTDDFAKKATAAMLGMGPDEAVGEAEVNDVVGEITNMVAGGLKSHLNDLGAGCAMSTPGIIRGSSFVVETVPDVVRELLGFVCEGSQVLVELHIHSKGKMA